tara:strand:+ start:1254 stop:1520 length:267 start_codon:yes stop_codon:yes gene_type:complete
METETKILQDKIKELSGTIILLKHNIDTLVSESESYDELLSEFQKVRVINMELEKKNDKVKEHVMSLLKEMYPLWDASYIKLREDKNQ